MSQGWIKLDRDILQSWLWENESEPFDRRSAWIDLLLRVNHEDKNFLCNNGTVVLIKRGAILTSVRGLSERWKWSKDRVLRFLRMLEKTNMIEKKSTNEYTILRIFDYEESQSTKRGSKQYGAGYYNGSKDKEIEMLREKIKELEGE